MKKIFAILLLILNMTRAMNAPMSTIGTKRGTTEEVEEIAPAAKEGRVELKDTAEEKRQRIQQQVLELQSKASLAKLPHEIIEHIIDYLKTAKGFGRQKLYKAAGNLRNFLMSSKELSIYLQNIDFNTFFIDELSKMYHVDKVEAALALHTTGAQQWLVQQNFQIRHDLTKHFTRALKEKDSDTIEWLLKVIKSDNSLSNKYKDDEGMTPLMAAAQGNNLSIIEYILSSEDTADFINKRTFDNKKNALSFAARNGNTAAMQLLMDAGAQLFWVTNAEEIADIETALKEAIDSGNIEAISMLLTPGMIQNINRVIYDNLNPLQYVLKNGPSNKKEIVALLLKTPNISLTGSLYYARGLEVITLLLEAGANVNDYSQEGSIIRAIEYNGESDFEIKKIIELYLSRKPDLNLDRHEDYGKTPLMVAVQKGLPQTIKLLIEKGANALSKDDSGKTALDYAQQLTGDKKDHIIKMLTAAGQRQKQKDTFPDDKELLSEPNLEGQR